jgi:hypothetical protein
MAGGRQASSSVRVGPSWTEEKSVADAGKKIRAWAHSQYYYFFISPYLKLMFYTYISNMQIVRKMKEYYIRKKLQAI